MSEDTESDAGAGSDIDPASLGGCFLISDINLADRNFYRTVVLMITHDEGGAFGLVVNRPAQFTLGDVVEGMEDTAAASIPVYVGGPVQQEALFVLHADFPGYSAESGDETAIDGVAFEPATRRFIDFLKNEWGEIPEKERPAVRVYAGYSGWGPGQVEGELKADAWVIIRATEPIIFHPDPQGAWAEALGSKGPLYQIILQTGFKPSMN